MDKLKVQQAGVPAGTYMAKFAGVEMTNHIEYGKGLRFTFEIMEGPCAGMKASRVTSAVPTPKNNAGRMLSDLTGKPLKPQDEVDVNQYLGGAYRITVEETNGGASRVRNVMPVAGN